MNTVNKLLIALNESPKLSVDTWCKQYLYASGKKKWLGGILPSEILNKSLKSCIEILCTISEDDIFYEEFPNDISSPNYGDKWGRNANYIEINNRSIAEMENGKSRNGIISTIKLLPAIPPSAKSWANCVILSQIFPNIYGDGYTKPVSDENSIYGIKLNAGYSQNIIDFDISDKITPIEQFKAFNDFAHFHGLKTGFRTVISSDQIKVAVNNGQDLTFDWNNKEHEELFIQEHVELVKSGFEAIFVDSAKHIGFYDMENYSGVGALPRYDQMQYIINEIRLRSGNTGLSFIGEKSTDDFERYQNLGLTSGTTFIQPDNFDNVKNWSIKFKYKNEYAPGVEVSNDNDKGGRSYEARLERINNSLFAYEYPSDKLASFMQMEDLFPLRYDANTHLLMLKNPTYSTDGTKLSHWENLFTKDDGRVYNARVSELFTHSLNL